MLRDDVESALCDEFLEDGYLFPDYEGYCFANVPHAIASILDVPTDRDLPTGVFEGVETDVEHVICVLIDGLGYDAWKRDRGNHRFLARLTKSGPVTPLTSIYPSETAAAIPTFHTGLLPVEHGSLGWDQYVEEVDAVYEVLPGRPKEGETPVAGASEIDPNHLFEGESIYPRFSTADVAVHSHQPEAILLDEEGDPAPEPMIDGAERHPYENVPELALSLRRSVSGETSPSYHYAYLPHVDTAAHRHGTESADYHAQLSAICHSLERELLEELDPATAAETLLVVTADHGELNTDPAENVDLSEHEVVMDSLRRRPGGGRVPPVGGPRNLHLHLEPDRIDRVREYLDSAIDARIFSPEEGLARDLWGPGEPGSTFARRCGDLVVVPRDRSIHHSEDELKLIGMHGGLSPEEMLVPFAAARLSEP